jgi:hypothetical protein
MASVSIHRCWPDGDVLSIDIDTDNSYPDALNEAKRIALDAYAEALGVTVAVVEPEAGE